MNRTPLLFLNVIIIATCGLIYELLAGTLSSYVLGDSVTQFSFIIGIYLFAMGVGSWLSKYIDKHVAEKFIDIELAVAVLGGFSAPLLFLTFAYVSYFQIILYSTVFLIGTLVGLEIPLLMRILKDELDFKTLVSRVLALDYVGALVASLMFPIFLVPRLGLNRTSLLFGMLNAAVAVWATWLLEPLIKRNVNLFRVKGAVVIVLLLIAFIKADSLTTLAEDGLFQDNIIYAKSSQYQRIVVTKGKTGYALFLNGNLQFNSFDEYRYHEALVHPAFAAYEGSPTNTDAFVWLDNTEIAPFDIAIVDFPDPNNFALGKLYTTRFYNLLKKKLTPDAAVVIQCTSPLIARNSYWSIVRTVEAAGFTVKPYQTTVPSFGVWGYALAKQQPFEIPHDPPNVQLKFLNTSSFASMFEFPTDMAMPNEEIEINRLDNQALVRYYETEWRRFE